MPGAPSKRWSDRALPQAHRDLAPECPGCRLEQHRAIRRKMNDWNLFEFRFRRSNWCPGLEPIITLSKIPYGEFSQCRFEQGITQRSAYGGIPLLLRHSTSTQRTVRF